MRIGIDARSLEEERGTGVARYLRNLLREFARIAPDNRYVLYFKERVADDDLLNQACFLKEQVKMSFLPRKKVLWEQAFLPKAIARSGVEVLFSPSYLTPLFSPAKSVVTIHDITYEVNPGWFHPKERLKMRTLARLAARRANRIIAVSQTTKNDLIQRYKVVPEKVSIVYEASDPKFRPIEDKNLLKMVKEKYQLKDKFIFYLGSLFARRNIPRLLEAFQRVIDEFGEVQLLIVGEDRAYPSQDIPRLVSQLALNEKVIWFEYVSEDDLPLLYNAAELFVYPSSYEGFGLPVLEAMASGRPVVTSNLSCLPEITGKAALLVDPTNPEEMAEAMVKILKDEKLMERLSQEGLKRAESFSWRRTAEETLKVFEEVAGVKDE